MKQYGDSMRQIKKFMVAFCIPIFLFLVSYYLLGYTVRHENYIISDMKGQYVALFSYLQDVFHGNESIFYSFRKGMGGSMLAAFAYYLSSPLNLVLIFFEKANIPIALFLILILKIGLSGGTMYLYLSKHYKTNKNMTYLFSTSYALMGYVLQYYFHIMWLDAVYLLPIVLLAIDHLIEQNKKGFYLFLLFITIVSNFYTGYMICIFSLLYFIIQMSLQKRKIISTTTLHFLVCSILAVLLSAGLLLPTVIELRAVYRSPVDNLWNVLDIASNFKELLSKLYIGAHNCKNVLNYHGTNLYGGVFIVVLVYFYFTNTDISLKRKMLWGGLLIFLVISSIFPFLIYLWHGFSIPNGFMNRNAFLLTFLLILLSFESYNQLGSISLKKNLILFSIFALVSLVVYLEHYEYLHLQEIVLTGCFLSIYVHILYMMRYKQNHSFFIILFVLSAVIEILLNFQFTFQGTTDIATLGTIISEYENLNLDSNYRMGNQYAYSGLDSMVANRPTLTTFLSTNTKKIHEFMTNVGYPSSGNTQVDINENTIVIDSLLNVGTYIKKNKSIGYEVMKPINWLKESTNVYQNPYVLPIGYLIEQNPTSLDNRNAFRYQNDLIKSFSGIMENPLELVVEMELQGNQFKIPIPPGDYYVQIHYNGNVNALRYANVIVNERTLKNWEVYGIFQITNVENDITVSIPKLTNVTIEGISIYQLNATVLEKQIEVLQKNTLKDIQKNKNKLSGTIEVSKKSLLFLSIPYEEGWKVSVDNKPVSKVEIVNAFLGIELDIGIHEIEFEYVPPGVKKGIIVTIICFFITIFYFMSVKKSKA